MTSHTDTDKLCGFTEHLEPGPEEPVQCTPPFKRQAQRPVFWFFSPQPNKRMSYKRAPVTAGHHLHDHGHNEVVVN